MDSGGLVSWQVWNDETPRPGWANMAIDHALLQRAEARSESWLRLYRWEPYCLSFGRHEPTHNRYDVARINALGLDVVRRPTGGRAVWHARELTYAVAAPSLRFGSLNAAYLEIHRVLAEALTYLSVSVAVATRTQTAPLDAGPCFTASAGGELLEGDRKIVGSAQYRQGSALLQHGSILLEDDQSVIVTLTRGSTAMDRLSLQHVPSHYLTNAQGRALGHAEVRDAVIQAAMLQWGGTWEELNDPTPLLADASRYHAHYRSPTWTWAR